MAIRFLKEALLQAIAPEWRMLALIFLVLVVSTTAVGLSELDNSSETRSLNFIIAGVVRLVGILLLTVAFLRRATGSSRAAFMPDGAFWLRTAFGVLVFALAIIVRFLLPGEPDPLFASVARITVVTLVVAPLAVWSVALAVERPLAIDPRPWLRDFSLWLPFYFLWYLLIVVPLAALHAYIGFGLKEGGIARSAALEIGDGALSMVIVLAALSLSVIAYRRVANR